MNDDKESLGGGKFQQLCVAVQDLLCELRIDEVCLKLMAEGYSPDYPGPGLPCAPGVGWENPHCKVQLSEVVAQKLIDGGVIDYLVQKN